MPLPKKSKNTLAELQELTKNSTLQALASNVKDNIESPFTETLEKIKQGITETRKKLEREISEEQPKTTRTYMVNIRLNPYEKQKLEALCQQKGFENYSSLIRHIIFNHRNI